MACSWKGGTFGVILVRVCEPVYLSQSRLEPRSGNLKEVSLSVGRDVRKPVFGVFDIARLEPAYSATETS